MLHKSKIKVTLSVVSMLALNLDGIAWGKLPPPTEEQKLKTAEAKAKADEATKKANEQLTGAQDRVADRYIAEQKAKGIEVKPTPIPPRAPPADAAKK